MNVKQSITIHQFRRAFNELKCKHEQLQLITPQFETPLPPLQPAVSILSKSLKFEYLLVGPSRGKSKKGGVNLKFVDTRRGNWVWSFKNQSFCDLVVDYLLYDWVCFSVI